MSIIRVIILGLVTTLFSTTLWAENITINWILKPPAAVKVDDKFKVGWRVTGGQKVRHINIHVCPFKLGYNCAINEGRMDGVVLKGESNREYFQHFRFSDFKQEIKVGDKFYAVGHTYLDTENLLTDPIVITITE